MALKQIKVGDIVRIVSCNEPDAPCKGEIVRVRDTDDGDVFHEELECGWDVHFGSEVELYSGYNNKVTSNAVPISYMPMPNDFWKVDDLPTPKKPKSFMKKLTNLARKMLDKDTKSLIEANVLSDDLTVNDDQFVLDFIVSKYKTELAVEARERLKEEKKKA